MTNVWNKIDSGLSLIYANFLRVREHGTTIVAPHPLVAEGGKLQVELRYEGDIGQAEKVGFETIRNDGHGTATGALSLEDLPAITARDEVLSIEFGSEPQLHLEKSVPQIRADKVWTLGSAGAFSGNTGAGVFVGIIDTGADIFHPFLWRRTIPDRGTRIRRIWDMGLVKVPGSAETEPDVALLEGGAGGTYGVEYRDDQINPLINGVAGAMAIRHKDCAAHGTHVASTAAGDGRFGFRRVGVAPRADLIIVKLLALQNEPRVGATIVSFSQRFKDAVTYVRKVADKLAPPQAQVAINYSAGSAMGAHDGFDKINDWLSNEFRDAVSEGKIFVAAAGNSGAKRQHATIVFAAAGSIEIPFELFDTRTAFMDFDTCVGVDNTKSIVIHFYYPNGGPTLKADLKPQGAAGFTAGPAVGGVDTHGVFSGRAFTISNAEDAGSSGGVPVKRNRIAVLLEPNPITMHLTGTYTVRLTAGGPVTVHAWCLQHSRRLGIRVKAVALPPEVSPEEKFLVNSPGCVDNVITVGAYRVRGAPTTLPVADFSSRGPVPRHGVGGPPPPKPDIGAPGVEIHAAKSADILPVKAGQTISFQGTSMSAPHVTGAVALLLEKNKHLKPSDVRMLLQANALQVPTPVPDEIGGGRLDAKDAFDATP